MFPSSVVFCFVILPFLRFENLMRSGKAAIDTDANSNSSPRILPGGGQRKRFPSCPGRSESSLQLPSQRHCHFKWVWEISRGVSIPTACSWLLTQFRTENLSLFLRTLLNSHKSTKWKSTNDATLGCNWLRWQNSTLSFVGKVSCGSQRTMERSLEVLWPLFYELKFSGKKEQMMFTQCHSRRNAFPISFGSHDLSLDFENKYRRVSVLFSNCFCG